MIFGVGIDIENHHRFKKYLQAGFNQNQISLFFTPKELSNYNKANNHFCLALSFSCKEAFFKAFGNSEVDLSNIELLFNNPKSNSEALVHFSGMAKSIIENYNLTSDFNYTIIGDSVIFEALLTCP